MTSSFLGFSSPSPLKKFQHSAASRTRDGLVSRGNAACVANHEFMPRSPTLSPSTLCLA